MSTAPCPFKGSIVALVTPFSGGDIDYPALEALVDRQIAAGQQALVPCGSTGESATLTHEEHAQVVAAVVSCAAGRVPVIAGTGSNSTAEAIHLTREAEAAGASGALLISPYYNRPTQDGIYAHYRAVAESTSLPILAYNIPSRTASNIERRPGSLRLGNVVAVKDSPASIDHVMDTIALCGDRLAVLSGDDSLALPMIALGAVGVISAIANVVPAEMARLADLALAGRFEEAQRIHYALLPIMRACFLETNPIPIKAALAMLGQCREDLRLPLMSMSRGARERLRETLTSFGLVVAEETLSR
jgi:4-hydroxy-tetrahydrodipicolinate synthase